MYRVLVVAGVLFGVTEALHADSAAATHFAAEYFAVKNTVESIPNENPQPCIQYCSGRANVGDKQGLLNFVKACKGNIGDGCVSYLAEVGQLSDPADIVDAALACRDNPGGDCLKYVREHLLATDKASLSEYARACANQYNN